MMGASSGDSQTIPSTSAPAKEDASIKALPSPEAILYAHTLSLTLSDGLTRPVSTIFESTASKVLVLIFIRHYHCGLCMQYVQNLISHPSFGRKTKEGKDVQFIIIGHGSHTNIDRYAELTGCNKASIPIYSDEKKQLFKAFGVTNITTTLPDHMPKYANGKGKYTVVWESLAEMAASPWKLIWSGGDFKQLGGEVVFDQGKPIYAHRMVTSGDHTEVDDLLKVVGLV